VKRDILLEKDQFEFVVVVANPKAAQSDHAVALLDLTMSGRKARKRAPIGFLRLRVGADDE
jgi:hypothetical protein